MSVSTARSIWRRQGHLKVADYMALPDDGNRYELLEGELVIMGAPTDPHQQISINLVLILGPYVRRRKLGRLLAAPFDIVFKPDSVCQPDLVFASNERRSIMTTANWQGAPDLAVEIHSRGSLKRDRVVKRRIYARNGVTNLWFIDPRTETLEELILDLETRKYSVRTTVRGRRGTFRSAVFPKLAVPLAEVYRDVP
jgi:Uma2 family endonuclease